MLTKVDLEDAGPGLRERIMEKLLTVEHSSSMQADRTKTPGAIHCKLGFVKLGQNNDLQ